MMSEKVIQLRRRLAERIPHWHAFPGDLPEQREVVWRSGSAPFDDLLQGGLARGTIVELVAEPNCPGSALLLSALLQQAAQSHHLAALIDGTDSFDPAGAGRDALSRLLWVRCRHASQALKAADLVLRDRNLPLAVLDLKLNPPAQLRKIPASIWFRLQRIVEAAATTVLVLTPQPLVGSAQTRLALRHQFRLETLQQPPGEVLGQLQFEVLRRRRHSEEPTAALAG